jgi:hypothetical protein
MSAALRDEHLKTLRSQALRLRTLGRTDIEIARELALPIEFVLTQLMTPPQADRVVLANDAGFHIPAEG